MAETILVAGAGAWGTTLAILLSKKGHEATLWTHDKELKEEIARKKENKQFLPDIILPPKLTLSTDPKDAGKCSFIIFASPSQYLREIVVQFKGNLNKDCVPVVATKGFEETTLKRPSEIVFDEVPAILQPKITILSGPNLAKEIAKEFPAAAVCTSQPIESAMRVQRILMSEKFRVYTNQDMIGVELGGALKNVIAIAAGAVDGTGLGDNAKAALIIRGIAEITRLGIKMGANPLTFSGLSGMGDLIATCSSKLSRNHYVGEQLARGRSLENILSTMRTVAEGVPTTKVARTLAQKYHVEMPICDQVYDVLFAGKDPYQAIHDLMRREARPEVHPPETRIQPPPIPQTKIT